MLEIPLYGWLTCIGNSRKWKKTCYYVHKRSTQGGNFCHPKRGGGDEWGTFFWKWKLIGIVHLLCLLKFANLIFERKTDKQILNTGIQLEQELVNAKGFEDFNFY